MAHSYMQSDMFIRATRLIHTCTMTHSHICDVNMHARVPRHTHPLSVSLSVSVFFRLSLSFSLSLSLSLSVSVSVCLYLVFARMPSDQYEVLKKEEKPTERKTKWKMKTKVKRTHSPQCVSRSIHFISLSLSLEFVSSLSLSHLSTCAATSDFHTAKVRECSKRKYTLCISDKTIFFIRPPTACGRVCVCVCAYVSISRCECVHVLCARVRDRECVCVYVYMYIHIYTYMYIYI